VTARRANLHRPELAHDDHHPPGFRRKKDRLGPRIGASAIGGTLYELDPGEAICPYHYEYGNEEWLIVVAGTPSLRRPEGEDTLEPGDVICFPQGPEGAHGVRNESADPVRVLMLSTTNQPDMAVYPDSDKIGIYAPAKEDTILVRRESGVSYWDGEA
jgi:uncharacterized cupin superfamily protein